VEEWEWSSVGDVSSITWIAAALTQVGERQKGQKIAPEPILAFVPESAVNLIGEKAL
jgi:hypothetical protein